MVLCCTMVWLTLAACSTQEEGNAGDTPRTVELSEKELEAAAKQGEGSKEEQPNLGGRTVKESIQKSSAAMEMPLPAPDAMFIALKTLGKPSWKGVVKSFEPTFDKDNRTALLAGMLIADFFAHVEAKDKKAALTALGHLEKAADKLKITLPEDNLKALRTKVKAKKWKEVPRELNAINSEMSLVLLQEQKRIDLAQLIALGAYLEGAYIGTTIVGQNYSKKTAGLLQQAELVRDISKTKSTFKQDRTTQAIFDALGPIQKLMKPEGDAKTISAKQVQEMNTLLGNIRTTIVG